MVVEHLLHRLDKEEKHGGHRQRFAKFCVAWKECAAAGLMSRFRCRELEDPRQSFPTLDEQSPIRFSCPDEHDSVGIYILSLIVALAEQQNQFLGRACDVCRSDHGARRVRCVSEYWLLKGRIKLPRVSLLQVTRPQIICSRGQVDLDRLVDFGCGGALCAWEVDPARVVEPGSILVAGNTIAFDLDLMEQWAVEHFVEDKAMLEVDIDALTFTFAGESFERNFRFLEDLCAPGGVTQKQCPGDSCDAIIEAVGATKLLRFLEVAAAAIQRVRPTPDACLGEFCSTWVLGSPLPHTQAAFVSLQVGHVVDLYECTESRILQEAVQNLGPKYREPLSDAVQERKRQGWRGPNAASVFEILGRIALRWLSHEREKEDNFVENYVELARRQVAPDGTPNDLFADLRMKNVFHAAELARKLLS
eukprot:TRINITY_DN61247_c0_g1_i1.p1 TRINITY_DN61247_c0_g1~~TRINITY_DN61247_c0_g1_i1.p1  ORF type:complete len:453 (-),score=76.72 TRINITY_DN61247_c0_g1_i1:51-1307(-)